MNTRKFLELLLLGVFCTVCFTGNAQQGASTKFNVFVPIECSDLTTKSLVESYITRELRNLGDVTVNYQNDLYTHAMFVNVQEPTRSVTGEKIGMIVISAVYIEYLNPLLEIGPIFVTHLSHEMRQVISDELWKKKEFFFIPTYRTGFLSSGNKTDLQPFCRDIVAAFDIAALQPARLRR